MAVAYQSITNNGAGNTTFEHVTPAGDNRLFVAAVVWYDGEAQTISAATYGGNALTLGASPGVGNACALYYRVAPAVGAANVVITFSGAPEEGPVIFAISFEGVDQGSPIDDTGTDDDSGQEGSSVSTVLSSQNDGMCVATCYSYLDATITSGGGQTRRDTHTHNDDTGAIDTEAGAASVTMSFTDLSWATMSALALAPVAAVTRRIFITHT